MKEKGNKSKINSLDISGSVEEWLFLSLFCTWEDKIVNDIISVATEQTLVWGAWLRL